MDRLSFVFSLLLIVSVTTTFGSVIKARNPTKEELEELQSDPDSYPELRKIFHSGDVIPGDELTAQTLEELLRDLPSAIRMVAIGIDNESGFKWTEPTIYFVKGTAEGKLPDLHDEKAVLYGTHSIGDNFNEAEAIGVFAYYIGDMDKTLAVMYNDPYKVANRWNVRLYDGEKEADYYMFSDLYENDPIMTLGIKHISLGSGLNAIGSISTIYTNHITLEIHVRTTDVPMVV